MVTLFYQTAIDHVYFYEIEFAKLIIRYLEVHLLQSFGENGISLLEAGFGSIFTFPLAETEREMYMSIYFLFL